MPRFYFHLASKDSHIQDDSGKELATLNDAYEHARKLIHKILFHVRSCRNIGACLRATGSAKRTQANKDRCSKRRQIVTADKAKTQAYCDLTKLYDQVEAAEQKNDTNLEALTKQANALVDKLGPEYFKMAEGLEQVDLTSSEGKELLSILLELDKLCTR